jgi:hypothetical protein
MDIIHTFTRNISRNDLPRTQTHTCRLALPGIRLLGLRDTSLQTHPLQLRVALQRRRTTPARLLARPAAAAHLVVGCAGDGGGGKCAAG